MKRTILVLAIMLAGAFQSLAQNSLDGTWTYTKTDNRDFNEKGTVGKSDLKMSAKYVFDGESFSTWVKAVFNMDFTARSEQGESTDAVFYIEVIASTTGTLSYDGSVLTLTPDSKKKPQLEVNTKIEGIPGGNMVKSMVVNPLKKQLSAELKKAQNYKVVSTSETTLVLEDILSDKDLKAGKQPERVTLTRR